MEHFQTVSTVKQNIIQLKFIFTLRKIQEPILVNIALADNQVTIYYKQAINNLNPYFNEFVINTNFILSIPK